MIANTDRFRPAAKFYEENKVFTKLPENSRAYIAFWKEEANRSLHGYTVDGIFIPGYFYFYLNYCPIQLAVPIKDAQGNIQYNEDGSIIADRILAFPKFWDYDLDYFLYLDAAEKNGQHGCVLKARGKGYSFKHASMLNRNFFLIPNSKSYALASTKEYLLKDGLLTKTWEMMDFINQNTAWRKRRQMKDTDLHKRASYKATINGKPVEKGYKSEIIGVTLKNDPNRARGKRGKLILFEEAGSFPNLLQAWQIALPSVEQGSSKIGMMIAYGTGGEEGPGFDGLQELFDNPRGYKIKPLVNNWEDTTSTKECAFFVPDYMNKENCMDDQGNTDIPKAKTECESERKNVQENTKDRHALKRFIAEHCNTPREAMMRLEGNIFPAQDILGTLARLEREQDYELTLSKGKFIIQPDGIVDFKEDKSMNILYKYPIRDANPDAPCVIFEQPYKNSEDVTPHGIYVAGIDPYDHDTSNTGSLGSMLIVNKLTNRIVFEYTARPDTAREFYEQCRRALLYYNARALYENEKKGIFDYFESQGSVWLLCEEPKLISDILKKPGASRKYGMKMPEQIKTYGEGLIDMWLRKDYDAEKNIKILHKIRSHALLKELVAYSKDVNTDRVMALMCVVYQLEEERKYIPESEDSPVRVPNHKKDFFNRPIFTSNPFRR